MPRLKKILESHNNKLHVKKDDTVIVITGKDKGKKAALLLRIRARTVFSLKESTW